jgi:hypothetical protein
VMRDRSSSDELCVKYGSTTNLMQKECAA